jgi:hypothetical protein
MKYAFCVMQSRTTPRTQIRSSANCFEWCHTTPRDGKYLFSVNRPSTFGLRCKLKLHCDFSIKNSHEWNEETAKDDHLLDAVFNWFAINLSTDSVAGQINSQWRFRATRRSTFDTLFLSDLNLSWPNLTLPQSHHSANGVHWNEKACFFQKDNS